MKHLKLVVLLVAVLAVFTFASYRVIAAFSVGHLTVKNNSEGGFVAEVPFKLNPEEQAKSVEVSLGGPGHYAILNQQRPGELDRMRVRVDRDKGKAYIESDTPLRGPLDLIVKVTVDGGTILKKFPIALKSALAQTGVQDAIETTRRVAAKLPGVRGEARLSAGVYGPVRRGETLSQIAMQFAGEGWPLEEVIVALWRINPRQFAFGNMHALRANAYLDCSKLADAVAGVTLSEARTIIRGQWQEWKKIKSVRAASHEPARPLIDDVAKAQDDESLVVVATQDSEQPTAEVPSFPTARSVRDQLEVAAVANEGQDSSMRAAPEKRMVLVREAGVGPLAQLQMGVRGTEGAEGQDASVQPTVASQAAQPVPDASESALAMDLARLKAELASTKELLTGRMSGLEGKLGKRFLRSERVNQIFYAIFLVENLVLLMVLLISVRKKRVIGAPRREVAPSRNRVYVRNGLHQRYL